MKVIFIKDLKGQGKKNDILEVADGYAQNFLIKKGYAVAATQSNFDKIQRVLSESKLEESLLIKEMESLKNTLEKEIIIFNVSTGGSDKMFGKISTKQIKKELNEKGYTIGKTAIKLDHDITSLGTHDVEIELHKKVTAIIKVKVMNGR